MSLLLNSVNISSDPKELVQPWECEATVPVPNGPPIKLYASQLPSDKDKQVASQLCNYRHLFQSQSWVKMSQENSDSVSVYGHQYTKPPKTTLLSAHDFLNIYQEPDITEDLTVAKGAHVIETWNDINPPDGNNIILRKF